jgi:LPS O-antigen subunit length determinant protein (WzzB/FepE family)
MEKYFMSYSDIQEYKEQKRREERLNNLLFALWGGTIAIAVITLAIALFG